MNKDSRGKENRGPGARLKDLDTAPGAAEKRPERPHKGKHKRVRASAVPFQGRTEAREEGPNLQDIERDIATDAGSERYDVERE